MFICCKSAFRNSVMALSVIALILAAWIAHPLSPTETAICVFELVRRCPYQLGRWTGDPDSLFSAGFGDCRHKAAAQRRLLALKGVSSRHIQVLFNWADLPISAEILSILPETRGFHDTVELTLPGGPILSDATWDPALAKAGFPIMPSWDGIAATSGVTDGVLTTIREGDFPGGVNLYDHFGLRWPERSKTLEFNAALNAWMQEIRQTR